MKPKHDDCGSMEEIIHLSIDGRLDGEGRRRLENHIAACARCSKKLERLRAIEAGTRSIGLDEPPSEYWSTFSRRVIEKIEAGAGKNPAWSRARVFAGLFNVPRLRLAAGIASLAIVVVVGALYLRDRGRIVPSLPARNEVETVSEGARTVEPAAEMKSGQKSDARQVEKRRAPDAGAKSPEEPSVGKDRAADVGEAPSAVVAEAPSAVVAEAPSAVEPAATSRVEPSTAPVGEVAQIDALGSAKSPSVAERSKERAAIVDSTTRATEMRPASSMANALFEKKSVHRAMLFDKGGAASASKEEGFMLDGAAIPRVSAADTSMSEDALRSVIHRWRSHIERNPLDPKNGQGYVQVAAAYCHLARLTKDEAVISEGARLVQEYADRVDDSDLKASLLDSKARIESFRGK